MRHGSSRPHLAQELVRGSVMRKSSLALLAAAIGLAASQASAADLPRKAPAYVPRTAPMTWTGCYIGANIGGAWGRFELDTPAGEFSRSGSGFAGGGQFGCDYQFAGGLVIGFRNMFDGTTNSRDRTFSFVTPAGAGTGTAEFHNRWFDALTGRIGYSWQPNSLLYFQGGAVWSRVEADITVATPAGVGVRLILRYQDRLDDRRWRRIPILAELVGVSGRQLLRLRHA